MRHVSKWFLSSVLVLVPIVFAGVALAQQAPKRSITKITGDLYRFQNNFHYSVVMRFPAERALFAVDFIPVKAVAFRNLPDAYIPEWMESLKRVEAMDFDIQVPGHGSISARALMCPSSALRISIIGFSSNPEPNVALQPQRSAVG